MCMRIPYWDVVLSDTESITLLEPLCSSFCCHCAELLSILKEPCQLLLSFFKFDDIVNLYNFFSATLVIRKNIWLDSGISQGFSSASWANSAVSQKPFMCVCVHVETCT